MSGDPAQHPPRPRRVLSAAKARMSSSASASASASSSEISNLKSEISTRAEESGPSLRSGPGVGARQWTDAQWRGISTTGRSLLVSAAAGSGKTAVLAERCAYLVCDDADDARLLRNDVARQLFADRYELDPTNEFRDLVDAYADGNDERLVRLVIRAHEMQCSLVDPVAWSDRALARIRESAEGKDLAE